MAIGLALLLSSACGYGFEVLDTTDSEWVAPGYEVIEEAVIDPLEYGEPYLNDGSPTVGVHLSFVESDSGETWRVVFVLDRKVVVLQEGEDPVEIPVDLDIESCAFSPSGRFVVVHDGAEIYTGQNAARIDTWSGEAEIFDSQPDGQAGPRNILVSNSGSVLCGWTFFDQDLGLIGRGPEIPQVVAPVFSPSGAYCAAINMANLYLIDDEAELVWERSTVRNGTAATLGGPYHVFSPDERYLAVPLQTGLEVWDVSTGETVWRDISGLVARSGIRFSNDSSELIAGVMTWPDRIPGFVQHRSASADASSVILIGDDMPEHYFVYPKAICSAVLARIEYDLGGSRWVLLSRSLDRLVWASGVSDSGSPGYALPPSCGLSRDGGEVCVCESGRVSVLSIVGDS